MAILSKRKKLQNKKKTRKMRGGGESVPSSNRALSSAQNSLEKIIAEHVKAGLKSKILKAKLQF